MTRSSFIAASTLALLAACSQEPSSSAPAAGDTAAATAVPTAAVPDAPEATPSADPEVSGRRHQYTSLKGCTVVREEREEMPFIETECRGPGGHALRIADSDARQRMTLIPPTSEPYRLPLDRIGGGGFSSFGVTAEWRGPASGPFEPDSLVVRYNVAENPYPAPETSYLLIVRLGADPCLVAAIPPGPGQNAAARSAADRPGACMNGR